MKILFISAMGVIAFIYSCSSHVDEETIATQDPAIISALDSSISAVSTASISIIPTKLKDSLK